MKRNNIFLDTFISVYIVSVLMICATCVGIVNKPQAYSQELTYETVNGIEEQLISGKKTIFVEDASRETIMNAVEIAFDNPEVFFYNFTYDIHSITSSKHLLVFTYKYDDFKIKKSEIEIIANQILNSIIHDGMSDYDKAVAINNWICSEMTYQQLSNNDDQELYTAMTKKTTVCSGYAKLFEYLMDKAGIETDVISGTCIISNGESIPHSWNVSKINGVEYYFDTTWNDTNNVMNNKWCFVTGEKFAQTHIPSHYYKDIQR